MLALHRGDPRFPQHKKKKNKRKLKRKKGEKRNVSIARHGGPCL
jgi:hypothetical protein